MKYLFAITFLVLIVLSGGIYLSFPDVRSDLPVIYWVTDNNPARREQVARFHRWLIARGEGERVRIETMAQLTAYRARHYTSSIRAAIKQANADGPAAYDPATDEADLPLELTVPRCELRLDTANRDPSKQIIQGVSGVTGDVMDIGPGQLRYFVATGMLTDLTEAAQELGFSPRATFPAIEPGITVDGRQYTFPCNVAVRLLWVNEATFAKYGMDPPPKRWTLEQFESIGKAFVERANAGKSRREVFFANRLDLQIMHRSLGLSAFNETLTRCTLGDERFVRCLELLHKWTHEDHLLPSAAEEASFDTQSGYGGAALQLFNSGNYAMFDMGRYALIRLRDFGQLELSAVEPPHGGFPNTLITTRSAAVYAASPNRAHALRFLQYLADEAYNTQIVRDADALPPNPKFTETELFKRPPDHPHEHGVHEAFAEAAHSLAAGEASSPFVLDSSVKRLIKEATDKVMAGRLDPEAAAVQCAERINARIRRTTDEVPRLAREHKRLVKLQTRIDARRAAGEPVPLDWIRNPFYQHYYQHKGWAEPTESAATDSVGTKEAH
ncbi:MAG: ABC transporter substrate-binding protein [bacterium]